MMLAEKLSMAICSVCILYAILLFTFQEGLIILLMALRLL